MADVEQALASLDARRDELPSVSRRSAGRAVASAGGGEIWSAQKLDFAVADYFHMLRMELEGRPYNKSEALQDLRKRLNGRTIASVSLRHRNTSAVLDERGLPFIDGYKPMGNYPRLLAEIVDRYVAASPWLPRA